MLARTIRRAVGPEPRSKADPTAVGSPAVALLDWSTRAEPRPRTSVFRAFRSEPAFASVFRVCLEMGIGGHAGRPAGRAARRGAAASAATAARVLAAAARGLAAAAGLHALLVDVDRRDSAVAVGERRGRQDENHTCHQGGYQRPVQPPEHAVTVAGLAAAERKAHASCARARRRRGDRGRRGRLRALVRRRRLPSDDALVRGNRGLVAARSGRCDRHRVRACGHQPARPRRGRPPRGVRRLDPDLGQLGHGRAARVRAVQPGLPLRRRARNRDRAGAAGAGVVGRRRGRAGALRDRHRRARQSVLPQHASACSRG